jgi:hypothetical protein
VRIASEKSRAERTSGCVDQVDRLKRPLEEARRAGYRQAAPFAIPLKTLETPGASRATLLIIK